MIDWSQQMSQDFEYWKVDPNTWADSEKLDCINSCSLTYDSSAETVGTASFSSYKSLPECYVRTYLIANQHNIQYRIPLATNLVQTPSLKWDGYVHSASLNAYSPLLELKSDNPPIGYSVLKKKVISNIFNSLYSSHCRAPLAEDYISQKTLFYDFTAEDSDTWLSFFNSLLSYDDRYLSVNELGQVVVAKNEKLKSLPVSYIFTDDNSSIVYPDSTDQVDYYGVPNRVEVLYSDNDRYFFSRVDNTNPNSDLSIPNRGRVVLYRETSPEFTGIPNKEMIDAYAKTLLKSQSTIQHELTIKHGYCGVGVDRAVILNLKRAGLVGIKGFITKQSISCEKGLPVSSTIVYSEELWDGND